MVYRLIIIIALKHESRLFETFQLNQQKLFDVKLVIFVEILRRDLVLQLAIGSA